MPIENHQAEEKMDNEMETGFFPGLAAIIM